MTKSKTKKTKKVQLGKEYLADDVATRLGSINSSITNMREDNKNNSNAINAGNIDIYCELISAYASYPADKISTRDMNTFKKQLSDVGFSDASNKKKREKTQWVHKWFKTNEPLLSSNCTAELVRDKLTAMGITSEAKLVKEFNPNKEEELDKLDTLVAKIVGKPKKDGSGYKEGLNEEELEDFQRRLESALVAREKFLSDLKETIEVYEDELETQEKVAEVSNQLGKLADNYQQADLDNNPM